MTDYIQKLVDIALAEDIGSGDITTQAIVDEKMRAVGRISSKQSLVLAGIDVAELVFRTLDPDISWDKKRNDGSQCNFGDMIAIVEGNARAILSGERVALNFLQHLSGIATLTNKFMKAAGNAKVSVLDTRKTIPCLRALEKHAVKMGGGSNHRMGLYDHFLIKNNHINIAGSIANAVERAMKAKKTGELIEVETRNLKEVLEAASCGVDIIMLDNMSPDEVKEAVRAIKGRAKTEVSGNITIEQVPFFTATGAHYISVGALTHSAPAADLHMSIGVV